MDIIDLLRSGDDESSERAYQLMIEGADEIEKLRKVITDLLEQIKSHDSTAQLNTESAKRALPNAELRGDAPQAQRPSGEAAIGERVMPIQINCTSYLHNGKCTHQAAPRRLFGSSTCIVWLWESGSHNDPRELPTRCALCTPLERPPIIPQAGITFIEGLPEPKRHPPMPTVKPPRAP